MLSSAAAWTYAAIYAFLALAFAYGYYERKTGVPTFPTMPPVRRKIIEILKRDMAERPLRHYNILDLGSGSGQMTSRIARALPDANVTGIELSYIPWLRSVVSQKLFGPRNLAYLRLDFWAYDCSAADAVVTYLPGKIMERVGDKLRKELRSGTLIAANTFALRAGWKPVETFTLRAPLKTNVYVYRQS